MVFVLSLENISVIDLYNSGSFYDAQDPSVIIKIGKNEFKTERIKDGGVNAKFPEKFTNIQIPINEFNDIEIFVEAHNIDANGKSKDNLGISKAKLIDIIPKDKELTDLTFSLIRQGKSKGQIKMQGILFKPSAPVVQAETITPTTTATTTIIIPENNSVPITVSKHNNEDESVPVLVPVSVSENEINISGPIYLTVEQLSVLDIEDSSSFMDKQDPCIKLKIGSQLFTTERIKEGGTKASFNEIYTDIKVNYEDEIEIEVHNMDKNLSSKKLVGKGKFKINEKILKDNYKTSIIIQLTNSKDKLQGSAMCCCTIKKRDIETKEEVVDSSKITNSLKVSNNIVPKKGKVRINLSSLSINSVEDNSSILDKQDPSLSIKIGKKFSFRTKRIQEGGTSASFPESYNDIVANYDDYIDVECHNTDSNGNSKKCLGIGKIRIYEAIQSEEQKIKFKIPLTTTSNKQQGEVNMEGILWVVPIENPRIKLSLDEISAIDLHDTGNFLDTQDPLLYLKVGKFNFKTDRVKDGGTKCSFKEIYNDLDLYYEDDIEVEIHNCDENKKSKALLGKGSVKISDVIQTSNEKLTFIISLVTTTGKVQGQIRMRGKVEMIPSLELSAPKIEGLVKLTLDQLSCIDIEDGGNILNRNDPAIHIKVGKFNLKTKRIKEGGTCASFSERFEDIKVNYNEDIHVEVHNCSEDGDSLKLLGTGIFKLCDVIDRNNCSIVFMVELLNTAQKKKGLVYMRGSIEILPKIVYDSFKVQGKGMVKLSLNQLSISSVYDSGSALDSQDPALHIKVGKYIFKTKRILDGGGNANFPEFYEDMIVDADDNIEVEVHSVDVDGKSKYLAGKGRIKISDAIESLNDSSSFVISVPNPKKEQESKNAQVTMRGKVEIVSPKYDDLLNLTGLVKLSLSNISVVDLIDSSAKLDKQDPGLFIKVNKFNLKTARVREGGTSAEFPEIYSDLTVDIDDELHVECHNCDHTGASKKLLGKGKIKLKKGIDRLNEKVAFFIDLEYSPGKEQGRVNFTGKLELLPPVDPNAPKLEGPIKLSLSAFSAHGIIDIGNYFDRQDPSLSIKIGKFKFKTNRIKEGGTSPVFPEVYNDIIINDYETSQIEVEIHNTDDQGNSKGLIGQGSIKIIEVIKLEGVNTSFVIPLTNPSVKSSTGYGTITMRGNITMLPKIDPNAPKISGDVKLALDMISMSGVEDSGTYLLDKQDPAIKIKVGKFNYQTKRVIEGGTSAAFSEVYKDIIAKYEDDSIEVEVINCDSSGNAKKVVGRGKVKISEVIQIQNEKISFVIPLNNSSNKEQGIVTMRGMLEDVPEVEIVKRSGRIKLSIDQLSIIGVEDSGNLLNQQDPALFIKIGRFNFKTNRVTDGGTSCRFTEIYDDIMVNYEDDIFVEIHNLSSDGSSKKLLGRGSIKIYEAVQVENEPRSFTIQLVTTNNDKKGQAIMRGKVEVLKIVDQKIKLCLDNLSIRDVEDSGTYLLDKQDPALYIKIGKFQFKTKRIQEGGTSVSFPETYKDIAVYYEDEIEVEVHNIDSNNNSKKFLGRGVTRISEVMRTIGEPSTFLIPLTTASGKPQGVVCISGKAEKAKERDSTSTPVTGRIKLNLDQLAISDVENDGSIFDKNDPSLKIKIGKHVLNTKRLKDAGSTASFPEIFNNISTIYEEEIEVEVHNNDSSGNSKGILGRGKLRIADAVENQISPRTFTIPLLNSSYEPQGSVTMRGYFEVPQIIDAKIKLSLSSLAIDNVENTGNVLDKQDPSIHIKINKLRLKTGRVKEGGIKCTFKEVYNNIKANYEDDIDIEVHNVDENDKSKRLIGKGTIKISEAISKFGESMGFRVPLTTETGKLQGEVTMEGLVELVLDDPNAIKIKGAVKLNLDQLAIADVMNAGTLLNQQDPCIFIKVSKNAFKTRRIPDGGSDASFPEVYNDIIVPDFLHDEIEVEVHNVDSSGNSKKKLGKGAIKVCDAIQKFNDSTLFSIDLISDGNIQKGQVIMRGILGPIPKEDLNIPIIEGLVKLTMDQLSVNDLEDNSSLFDPQDPAIYIKVGKFNFKTKRIEEGGTSASFSEIYNDIIVNYNSDEIEVEAHNVASSGSSKKLLGRGKISISQSLRTLNDRKVLSIDLIDSTNKSKGQVVMRCKLEQAPKVDPNAPKIEGSIKLNLDQLSAFGLINSASLLDGQDPSLTIKVGQFVFKTKRVLEGGVAVSFPESYNDIISNYDNGEIEVEVHNTDSNDRSKQLLGKGKIKISEAIQCLGEKVSFVIPLENTLIKSSSGFGQVVMRGSISLGPKIDPNAPKITGKVKISLDQLAINDVDDQGSIFDKQDPELSIKVGNFSFKTSRVVEGGTSTTFSEEYKDIIANYDTDEITVDVSNVDSNGKIKSKLGTGKIKLSEVFLVQNELVTLKIDLITDKQTKGNVIMRGKLEVCKIRDPSLPPIKGPVKLTLDQLAISDVQNDGSILDRQDPAVFIKIGSITYKTKRIPEGGTSTAFPEIFKDIMTNYNDDIFVEVHNCDSKGESKKKVGMGSIKIADAIQVEKEHSTFIIPLMNSSNKPQGTIVIRGILEVFQGAPIDSSITSKFINLSLSNLSVTGAEDTGNSFFDKQDPAIRLKISKQYTFTTSRYHDGGSSASFGEKYNDIILDGEEVKSGLEIITEVHNLDDIGKTKKVIGKGSIKVTEAIPTMDDTVTFRVPLTNSVGKIQGFVEMNGRLKSHTPEDLTKRSEELKKIEETKKAEEDKKAEEVKKAEEIKKIEEAKKAEEAVKKDLDSSRTIAILEDMTKKQADELAKLYKYIETVQKKQEEKSIQIQKQQEDQLKQLNQEFKKQLTTELSRERTQLLDTINSKTAEIINPVASMATYSVPTPTESPSRKSKKLDTFAGISVAEMTNVKLPSDVCQWRTIHVQAWLAFKMELPMYMEAFQKASVDGLLLIRHINDDILSGDLCVENELHRKKLLESITKLRQKQDDLEQETEKKRKSAIARAEAKEKLRQQQIEAEAKLAEERAKALALKIAEDNAKAAKEAEKRAKEIYEAKEKPKKKKVKKASTMNMVGNNIIPAEIRERNQLVRTKLERVVGNMRERDHDTADGRRLVQQAMNQYNVTDKKNLRKTAIWAHEYNGAPKPEDNIWLTPSTGLTGSKDYQRAMVLDVLGSNEFANSNIGNIKRPPRLDGPVQAISKNCSPDEVITVLKGAMYEVSSWLLQLEELELEKRKFQDSDLLATEYQSNYEDYNDDNILDLNSDDEIEDEESLSPPPIYSEPTQPVVNDTEINPDNISKDLVPIEPLHLSQSSSPPSKTQKLLNSLDAKEYSIPDRMTLIFNAFVNQKRNKAQWLGENNKLTRSKFDGGIESILKVTMSWGQFDSLWTRLDYKRSGTLDLDEFKAFFGDLSEFEEMEGNQTLDINSKDSNISELTKNLYKLCDTLRHAGFTINEMFAGFDRNGSGSISISEFCSMLRLVIGNYGNKRLLYRALMTLDSDGDKQISLQELLIFVYKIWRTQLDELASKFGDDLEENPKLLQKIIKERQDIKDAIKKNFPREWRDRFERTQGGHSITGPFNSLLKKMNINNSNFNDTAISRPTSPQRSPSSHTKNRPQKPSITTSGSNQLKRYKVKRQSETIPVRPGTYLGVPKQKNLNNDLPTSYITDQFPE